MRNEKECKMNTVKAVLFDLDGTLLPMDLDFFIKTYLGMLAEKLKPYGHDPAKFLAAMWKSTGAMLKNDGKRTNEEVFWETFYAIYGESIRAEMPVIDRFYEEDFDKVQGFCGFTPSAAQLIRILKRGGFRLAMATNPLFPRIATEKRIAWAGLSLDDFELITTYENSRFSKPNPAYYRAVADALGVAPEECLMIGNDVDDDMPARQIGMQVYLLTDCLINKSGADLSAFPHGSFDELIDFADELTR